MVDNEVLLEKLASLEHEQWCDWSKSLAKDLNKISKAHDKYLDSLDKIEMENPKLNELSDRINDLKERISRWEKLWISYFELSEEMKEEDRIYARKVLEILVATDKLK